MGSMVGVDKIFAKKEQRRYIKLQHHERQKKKQELFYIKKQKVKNPEFYSTINDDNEVDDSDEFSSGVTEEYDGDKNFAVKMSIDLNLQ